MAPSQVAEKGKARSAISAAERRRLAKEGITIVEGTKGGLPAFNFQGKKLSIGDERHPDFVGPKKPLGPGDTIGGKGGLKIIGKKPRGKHGGRVKAKSGGRIKRAKVLSRGKRR